MQPPKRILVKLQDKRDKSEDFSDNMVVRVVGKSCRRTHRQRQHKEEREETDNIPLDLGEEGKDTRVVLR